MSSKPKTQVNTPEWHDESKKLSWQAPWELSKDDLKQVLLWQTSQDHMLEARK